MATELIYMYGGDFRLGTLGSTWLQGQAFVSFTNVKTGKSFTQTYDIRCYDSIGLNTSFGGSAGMTIYTKVFKDDNVSEGEVINSYTGIFATMTASPLNIVNPMFKDVHPKMSLFGFSISTTLVVGVDADKGFFGQPEMPWVGVNLSLNLNLIDLAFNLCGGQNPIPSGGIQYSVYKKTDEKWTDYNAHFTAARNFAFTNFPIPQITRKAIELINEQ